MTKIKMSSYLINKAEDFAKERIGGSKSLYSYRGESNIDKMREDIVVGTLGEYAVWQYVKNDLALTCTKPDTKIYGNKRKSFDADLFSDNVKIHVKSQSVKSIKRYGKSWLMQKTDKLVSNPEASEYFAFTSVDLDSGTVEILGFVHALQLSELNLYGECRVPWYRKTKVAIYLDDLEPHGIIGERFK